MPKPYYITTPIYYVNDRPHIGHCYTTSVADAAARFQRLVRGIPSPSAPGSGAAPEVFLLTGTDEHADKVVTSAAEHGVSPQTWADRNAAEFRAAFDFMNTSYDDFIRTTELRHKDKVAGYIKDLMGSGDIYKGEYTGWYDAGQEEYVTETAAKDAGFKSPINGKPLVRRTEPCYFFRLSKYQARLHDLIASDTFRIAPDARKSEVLGRLRPPAVLNDVPVSRPVTDDPATQWGIRIPGDPANRIYVWIDALFNYLSTVDTPERRHLWPAAVHLIGKDILWFHAVIWPALLIALKRDLPAMVFGHGWWISEGQKMSKSLGNFIDLEKLKAYAGRYSLDALRWYLLTQGPLSGGDSDFSHAKFVEVYNSDLANGIGNSTSRVANMIEKYFGGRVPDPKGKFAFSTADIHIDPKATLPHAPAVLAESLLADAWPDRTARLISSAQNAANAFEFPGALEYGTELVVQVDGFINATAPFKLAKAIGTDPAAADRLAAILYCCAESLRIASLLLSPAMPQKMADLWRRWSCSPPPGVPLAELATFGHPVYGLKPGTPIEKGEALFMRADPAEPPPGSATPAP